MIETRWRCVLSSRRERLIIHIRNHKIGRMSDGVRGVGARSFHRQTSQSVLDRFRGVSIFHHKEKPAVREPTCSLHPDAPFRRYRTQGPNGPGVYPQCVPGGGEQSHLLSWADSRGVPAPRADDRGASPPLVDMPGLSQSERGVLGDAANGMSVIETATSRSKSPETVKTQRRSILLKLGARNMPHAVAMMMSERQIAIERAA
jgi:DNA-binding CsgD family transcriptional regulator